MIIKYYSPAGSTHIIAGVQDVSIIHEPEYHQYLQEPWQLFDDEGPAKGSAPIISYAKDGPCALAVRGTAYICNDEGKTIEKVTA